jgi:transcriptional regulator with XRE-family HTH domain
MRPQEIGHSIQRARKARGITQARLAEEAGVSRTTINQLENGALPDLGIKKIQAILARLGMALSLEQADDRPDSIKMSAITSSVSFQTPLTEDELVKALITGKIPAGKRPHFRVLLDEGSHPLLISLAREAKRWTKAGRIERNLAKIAREVGSTKRTEDWLKTV